MSLYFDYVSIILIQLLIVARIFWLSSFQISFHAVGSLWGSMGLVASVSCQLWKSRVWQDIISKIVKLDKVLFLRISIFAGYHLWRFSILPNVIYEMNVKGHVLFMVHLIVWNSPWPHQPWNLLLRSSAFGSLCRSKVLVMSMSCHFRKRFCLMWCHMRRKRILKVSLSLTQVRS